MMAKEPSLPLSRFLDISLSLPPSLSLPLSLSIYIYMHYKSLICLVSMQGSLKRYVEAKLLFKQYITMFLENTTISCPVYNWIMIL